MAEDELRRINSFRSPGDKINCIVRCCSVIFSVLNLARGDSGSRPGADDFLPVFIYIVLHSKIQRLHSNCEYIAAYRNPADLMSKCVVVRSIDLSLPSGCLTSVYVCRGGYCFVNLRSAIEFINVLDASMLSISQDEFQRLVCFPMDLKHMEKLTLLPFQQDCTRSTMAIRSLQWCLSGRCERPSLPSRRFFLFGVACMWKRKKKWKQHVYEALTLLVV